MVLGERGAGSGAGASGCENEDGAVGCLMPGSPRVKETRGSMDRDPPGPKVR